MVCLNLRVRGTATEVKIELELAVALEVTRIKGNWHTRSLDTELAGAIVEVDNCGWRVVELLLGCINLEVGEGESIYSYDGHFALRVVLTFS